MRYHTEKPDDYVKIYGETYHCDHPVYSSCTLFKIGKRGLAVIQQQFYPEMKATVWGPVDDWLVDKLYLHPKFKKYFDKRAQEPTVDLYPTVTVRQLMWALRMKPLKKKRWETCFDRADI